MNFGNVLKIYLKISLLTKCSKNLSFSGTLSIAIQQVQLLRDQLKESQVQHMRDLREIQADKAMYFDNDKVFNQGVDKVKTSLHLV